jgi:uncharacterized protein (TIGR01777 family)
LRIAISGTSGLVGRQLVAFLTSGGHEVLRLVRVKTAGTSDIYWDPETGNIDAAGLEGLDAVVHLAGANISQGRWTDRRRMDILQSRVRGTSLLAETLAALARPPAVFISASAVGIYGDGGDALLTEASEHGDGFLPTVCEAWERAADPARRAGIRVVHPRMGVVITSAGGMLGRVLPLFKLGLGGHLGSGAQWMSWIALDDLLAMLLHMIHDDSLEGPLNAVSQAPVTNAEFTSELAHILRRPAYVRAPAAGLRLAFGDIADELLLESQRAVSTRLAQTSFSFTYPEIGDAIQFELGRLSANVVLARVRAQSTASVLGAVA